MYCLDLVISKYVCSTYLFLWFLFLNKFLHPCSYSGNETQGILCYFVITRKKRRIPSFLFFRKKSLHRKGYFFSTQNMVSQHLCSRHTETGLLLLTEASARGLHLGSRTQLFWNERLLHQRSAQPVIALLYFSWTFLCHYAVFLLNKPSLHEHQVKLMWKKLIDSFLLSLL